MTVQELREFLAMSAVDGDVLIFNSEFNTYEPCDGVRLATVTRTDIGLGEQYEPNETGTPVLLIGGQ